MLYSPSILLDLHLSDLCNVSYDCHLYYTTMIISVAAIISQLSVEKHLALIINCHRKAVPSMGPSPRYTTRHKSLYDAIALPKNAFKNDLNSKQLSMLRSKLFSSPFSTVSSVPILMNGSVLIRRCRTSIGWKRFSQGLSVFLEKRAFFSFRLFLTRLRRNNDSFLKVQTELQFFFFFKRSQLCAWCGGWRWTFPMLQLKCFIQRVNRLPLVIHNEPKKLFGWVLWLFDNVRQRC